MTPATPEQDKRCHICGQKHKMAATPFPFVYRSDGLLFCPYDVDGVAVISDNKPEMTPAGKDDNDAS